MRVIDLLHRWCGGLLGLILAVLGLSGAILVHKEAWIGLPHAHDAVVNDPVALGRLTTSLLENAGRGESIIYASDSFGLVQLRAGDSGRYVTQSGKVVAEWSTLWERPELWLFDLHHHLFAGGTGEFVAGVAGLGLLAFVVTGTILWWRNRRSFRLRLWPANLRRTAILAHHRNLGIVVAPMLLLSAVTGTMMVFRPVAALVLSPLSSRAEIEADLAPPPTKGGELSARPDWTKMIATAQRQFPDAQLRILSLPRKAGGPITVRMKRAGEWLPNGRTMLWFDPATGAMLAKRDALRMKPGTQAFNLAYPLHAAKVGGLPYRILISLGGLALTMLGLFATWSFWFLRRGPARPSAIGREAAARL